MVLRKLSPPVMAVALLLAGCGGGTAEREAAGAASEFLAAQPAQACLRLAPDTARALERESSAACPEALAAVRFTTDPTPQGVELAGESAQVRFADDVVFLARFADGWRVTAAGCRRTDPDPAVPYECEVSP